MRCVLGVCVCVFVERYLGVLQSEASPYLAHLFGRGMRLAGLVQTRGGIYQVFN